MKRSIVSLAASACLVALTAVSAGTASATLVKTFGTGVIQVVNFSETAPSTFSSDKDTAFFGLPGAVVTYDVTSRSDLFTVTFSAETQCRDASGPATGWCSMRVVATQGETVVVFNPNAATNGVTIRDFAFASNPAGTSNADEWESHSVTQSARLPEGRWVIRVQRAIEVTAGATAFRLDDWNLTIIQSD